MYNYRHRHLQRACNVKLLSEVVAQFPAWVLDKYDFDDACYHGALQRITGIRCPIHGVFSQYPAQLRKGGATCPACGVKARADTKRLDTADFLARAESVHPGKYLYDKTQYVNMHALVTVTCKVHGDFSIRPVKLVHAKQGCPVCADATRGYQKDPVACRVKSAASKRARFKDLFVQRARAVHGDLYSYDEHGYTAARQPVRIVCKTHGEFFQTAYHHLAGQGCPQCGNTKSAGETQVATFLSNMTSVERRNRRLLRPKELDIYLPEHKLAVEYCGMYWHSHGSKEEELQDKLKHVHKHEACAALGIRLLTLWETEWKDRQFAIKRMLRNAIGKTKGKLMARKCELRKASNAEARAFYDKYHPQGGAGHGEHYALFWKGKMVACMRFVHGANDRGAGAANRMWTLGRYATRINVAGAASRLFKAFVREHNPDMVKSFSDNRLFTGAMYPQLGFTLDADIAPDYQVWSPKLGLRPKSHYQRRMLQQRLRDHGLGEVFDADTDPRTEAEITYLIGARRLYDCGKKRWVWTSQN